MDGVYSRRSAVPFRENFARVCFQALLHFSFINSQEATIGTYIIATKDYRSYACSCVKIFKVVFMSNCVRTCISCMSMSKVQCVCGDNYIVRANFSYEVTPYRIRKSWN